MKADFSSIRLALFTHSYPGYVIANYIRKTHNQKQSVEKLSRVLLMDYKLSYCFILHKSCCHKFSRIIKSIKEDKKKIKVYLSVENELKLIIQERQDEESLIIEESERALLSPSIERVAGNTLKDIESDRIFERKVNMLQKTHTRWYYFISCKYRLPTIRIIPFILRLITINP